MSKKYKKLSLEDIDREIQAKAKLQDKRIAKYKAIFSQHNKEVVLSSVDDLWKLYGVNVFLENLNEEIKKGSEELFDLQILRMSTEICEQIDDEILGEILKASKQKTEPLNVEDLTKIMEIELQKQKRNKTYGNVTFRYEWD